MRNLCTHIYRILFTDMLEFQLSFEMFYRHSFELLLALAQSV